MYSVNYGDLQASYLRALTYNRLNDVQFPSSFGIGP